MAPRADDEYMNPRMSSVSVLPQLGSMTFWINACIPRDIFGATRILHEGDYRGLSIVSKAPCYLTDQRNFSNEPRAASRMHSLFKLDLAASEPFLSQQHRCDDLIECDPVSGEVLQKRRGSTSKMKFFLLDTTRTIRIGMECRHGDSIARFGHGIGEIEYRGTIEIAPEAGTVEIDIMICLFPAFEAYAVINDGPSAILFRHAPPAGILSLGPPRGAKRRIRSRLDDESFNRSNDE
jgi:hypothetical protein